MSGSKHRIGAMRHRIDIQQIVRVADDAGGFVRNDTTLATVWGDIMPLNAVEKNEYDQNQEREKVKIIMRYQDSIKQGMNLINDGIRYHVKAVMNKDQQKRYTTAICEVGAIYDD